MDLPTKKTSKTINLIIGSTGSIAALKTPLLIQKLRESTTDYNIILLPSARSLSFFDVSELPDDLVIFTDSDEWKTWKTRNDPILHIELRKWVDMLLIAPLSANSLAKLANGICDTVLLEVLRAWDYRSIPRKRIVVCPAMNTYMWDHPMTTRHLALAKEVLEIEVLGPISKGLACGDTGVGGMSEVPDIVSYLDQGGQMTDRNVIRVQGIKE